jgi:hypothetical protein
LLADGFGRSTPDSNLRPGGTMAMQWSAVTTLVATTQADNDTTRETVDLARSMIGPMGRSSAPTFSTTPPPNGSAVTTGQVVSSTPGGCRAVIALSGWRLVPGGRIR